MSYQADNDIDQFMKEKHNFDQYSREVRKYKRLADDIQYHCQKVREQSLLLSEGKGAVVTSVRR